MPQSKSAQHPPSLVTTQRPSGKHYPSQQRLSDPSGLEQEFRVLLDKHYALQDKVDGLEKAASATAASPSGGSGTADSGPKYPPGSGPKDTMLCGLNVQPVDPGALADGAKLQYDKKSGVFVFKP